MLGSGLWMQQPAHETRDVDVTDETVELTSLNGDILMLILSYCEESGVAAMAACCKRFMPIACGDTLWKDLVIVRWPRLSAAEMLTIGSWRDFHRERSLLIPSWRYFLVLMDEIEHLFGLLAASEADSSNSISICNQIATSLVAIFCTTKLLKCRSMGLSDCVLGYSHGRRWARRLCGLICTPAACHALLDWTAVILEQLDDFYDPHRPRGELQAILISSLRCASALTFLKDEIGVFITPTVAASDEVRFAFQRAVSPERVAEALRSLEMEGFDVSVPPALRPARLPHLGHAWWNAQTRQGYLGGVTNIR
mmetsp:Transcript_17732/g.29588  ORF Transcript_17732/g.29588 Transcript_17732/m.29588 type:complete len:310 (+) Transcript_17732:280-1209(+)|eukprot:CAMPEP_0119315472 /NCGR_PEP_ID=MMETSP1333-20130426/36031_1 /TAXON_ID=418940 /ORGANISM="Scyphosphaera apsteinii, Strain RCC1455" /LENGTH=309 /DNA_ID=CAMNT_0007320845 /DNA_START=146 /DNA_END=1075 /DNA_ORIENTATION=+